MIKLGVTGGIGSGKSVVTQLLGLYNIPVYVADIESKRLTESSPVIRRKLIGMFGDGIYKDGRLNKALLASHIFGDSDKLQAVNGIIHPEVKDDLSGWFLRQEGQVIVAVESAIAFESGFDRLTDKMIMVYTPLDMRIERVMKRDGASRRKVLDRIESQMPDEEKARLSDFVIDNSGSCSVIEQVQDILKQLNFF